VTVFPNSVETDHIITVVCK